MKLESDTEVLSLESIFSQWDSQHRHLRNSLTVAETHKGSLELSGHTRVCWYLSSLRFATCRGRRWNSPSFWNLSSSYWTQRNQSEFLGNTMNLIELANSNPCPTVSEKILLNFFGCFRDQKNSTLQNNWPTYACNHEANEMKILRELLTVMKKNPRCDWEWVMPGNDISRARVSKCNHTLRSKKNNPHVLLRKKTVRGGPIILVSGVIFFLQFWNRTI